MSNDRDQAIVASAVADTGAGLLEFLPSLGQREAIAFGDGMSLPARIKFDELPKFALPKSSTAVFSEKWQTSLNDDGFLDQVVERWRASGISTSGDPSHQLAMMADALSDALGMPAAASAESAYAEAAGGRVAASHAGSYSSPGSPARATGSLVRRDAPPPAFANRGPTIDRGAPAPSPESEKTASSGLSSNALRSLRERLTRP